MIRILPVRQVETKSSISSGKTRPLIYFSSPAPALLIATESAAVGHLFSTNNYALNITIRKLYECYTNWVTKCRIGYAGYFLFKQGKKLKHSHS
jgi:hypothetical protein